MENSVLHCLQLIFINIFCYDFFEQPSYFQSSFIAVVLQLFIDIVRNINGFSLFAHNNKYQAKLKTPQKCSYYFFFFSSSSAILKHSLRATSDASSDAKTSLLGLGFQHIEASPMASNTA